MAKKPSALAGIFEDEPAIVRAPPGATEPGGMTQASFAPTSTKGGAGKGARAAPADGVTRRSSHPGKKPVLIHIPEDMHRTLRQLSVEEGGEPLTVITERLLRQYLVQRGHTRFAP